MGGVEKGGGGVVMPPSPLTGMFVSGAHTLEQVTYIEGILHGIFIERFTFRYI